MLNPRHPGPTLPVTQAKQTAKTPDSSLVTMYARLSLEGLLYASKHQLVSSNNCIYNL